MRCVRVGESLVYVPKIECRGISESWAVRPRSAATEAEKILILYFSLCKRQYECGQKFTE